MVLYLKKVSPLYVFEDKRCYKRIPIFYKNKVHFIDTLSRRTYFWDTSVPCGSENSHNVVQLNPDEDKYYLLTPYPTLMQSLKNFHPKALELLLETQISIYNQLEYIQNPISNITLEHNNSTNYLHKWTLYKDNHLTKTYANLPKPQDLQISIHKIIADILKTLKTIYI